MNLYYLSLFIRFTCKILLRSKALWGCALLVFCCVNFFQIYFQSDFASDPFSVDFTAVLRNYTFPELMPYMNVYLLSVLLVMVLLFFSVSFLCKGAKMGMMEVIGFRPESNVEYVWGMVLGFLLVFGGLGLVCLFGGALIHLLWGQAPFMIGYYLFYYFSLFIPALLCWLGISFCITLLSRERGSSVFFLLVLYCVSILYMANCRWGVFDILGIELPNMFSQATGHSNLKLYLLQRGCWMLLGIGLLQSAVLLFGRIPNNPVKAGRGIIACLFLGCGCFLGVFFYQENQDVDTKRQVYAEIYAKFDAHPKVTMISHDITFQRESNLMKATSEITLQNRNDASLSEVIFYLNPALEIESIIWNGEKVSYERECQVVQVKKRMRPGETIRVNMSYSGKIDENVCYLDIPNSSVQDVKKYITCPVGKRYAFLENDYTLLLPEVLWYPVTVPPLNTVNETRISKNFTRYSLKVLGESDKVVISQGERVLGDGYTFFRDSCPLTGISICIGDYDVRSVLVDSVLYELYLLNGKFIPRTSDIRKPYGTVMPELLSEVKTIGEERVGGKYPYCHFRMVESPVTFTSYYRMHKYGSEFVQPEIVFFEERGRSILERDRIFHFPEALRGYFEACLFSEGQNEDIFTWKRLFDHRVNAFAFMFKNIHVEPNHHGIFPMFYWQVADIHSGDYPELEMLFFELIRHLNYIPERQIVVRGNTGVGIEVQDYLQKHSLKDAFVDKAIDPKLFTQVLEVKIDELLKRIIDKGVTKEQLKTFISSFMEEHRFSRLAYEDICQAFQEKFGIDFSGILSNGYRNVGLPVYTVEDFNVRKIGEEDRRQAPLAHVRFRVFNNSNVDGTVNLQSSNTPFVAGSTLVTAYETKSVDICFKIPAKTGKDVSLLLPDSPHYYALDLNACGNIPNCIGTELMDMVGECDTLQYVREFDGVGIPIGMNEIIVDNEDPGFLVVNSGNYSHFFSKKEQNVVDKYENLKSWLIPDDRWRFFIDHNAFGKFVRSAVIRRAGKGGTHVEWNVDLKREGRYEVFVHLPKFIYSGVSTKNRNPDVTFLPFNYVISSARGEDQVVVHAKQENNWVSLGIYDYTPGHYRVKLSDKGEADYTIVADAVKWVYVGQRETK
jgi:hypothetical protein